MAPAEGPVVTGLAPRVLLNLALRPLGQGTVRKRMEVAESSYR